MHGQGLASYARPHVSTSCACLPAQHAAAPPRGPALLPHPHSYPTNLSPTPPPAQVEQIHPGWLLRPGPAPGPQLGRPRGHPPVELPGLNHLDVWPAHAAQPAGRPGVVHAGGQGLVLRWVARLAWRGVRSGLHVCACGSPFEAARLLGRRRSRRGSAGAHGRGLVQVSAYINILLQTGAVQASPAQAHATRCCCAGLAARRCMPGQPRCSPLALPRHCRRQGGPQPKVVPSRRAGSCAPHQAPRPAHRGQLLCRALWQPAVCAAQRRGRLLPPPPLHPHPGGLQRLCGVLDGEGPCPRLVGGAAGRKG